MNAVNIETLTSPALPLDIAKAMKPLIIGKHADKLRDNLTCIVSRPTLDGYAEYIATNGHCLLIIETNTKQPGRQHTAWPASQVKTFIDSKGHAPLDSDAGVVHQLPDYDRVIYGSTIRPTDTVGLNTQYLGMMDKISTVLKLNNPHWRCTLHGTLNPTVWTKDTETHETITKLTFLIMPVMLD